jgi:cytochrome c
MCRAIGQAGRAGAPLAAMASLATVFFLTASQLRAEDADPGKAQFIKSCGVCHSVEKDAAPRQGPNLLGIVGRKAAAMEGFKYSEAMKTADWTWEEKNLDPWIENAAAVKPGTIMSYRQADPEKRALIIAYLKSLSPAK